MKPSFSIHRLLIDKKTPTSTIRKNKTMSLVQGMALAITTLALVQSASAASQIWQGDVSTDWDTTGNWVGGALPGGSFSSPDVATFNDGNTVSTAVTDANNTIIGAVTITGTNSYTFNTNILYFNNAAAFNNSSSGTITLSGTTYRGRRDGDSTFTNTGGLVSFNGAVLKEAPTAADAGDLIFDGSGNFQVASLGKRNGTHVTDLVKNGVGTLTLTGFQTVFATTGTTQSGLTGITTINNGTIRITSGDSRSLGSALSNSSNWLTLNGGTLQVSTNNLNLGGNATEGVSLGASGGTFNVDSGRTLTIGGAGGVNLISGSGALTKTGDGTLTLAATNTYNGATNVSAGTLYVTGALSNSAVTVEANGAIGSNGFNSTLANGLTIAAGGALDLTNATLSSNSSGILSLTGGSLTLGNLTFQDLTGWDWMNAAEGTYELIDGAFSVDFGSTTYLDAGSAYDFGNGRAGYFTNGGLNAVIIPEPSVVLLSGIGLLALFRRRR